MAEQDFKEKDNAQKKTNFTEIGRSGTFITSYTVQNDYLENMIGVPGQEEFAKMLLSDSQIRKLYHAISNPIKSAEWSITPASEDKKDLEVAALIEQILFEDLPKGFKGKLDEILTFPWHGHAVFEVIHKNKTHPKFGPYTGLSNLAFRDQRTLDKWVFSKEGILTYIHQTQSGDIEINADIPAENLLIFYNEQKGNDNGYPFCRMLYGNYKRKLLYKQLQAIGIERAAIPVPHLKLPEGIDYDSNEYTDAVEQLRAFTQAEQAFFVTPAGYELNYNQTGTFDPAKVQVAIKAENEEISGSLVAMWLEMGIGGNSAVGSSTGISAEFFRDGIEYLADKIAQVINQELIPNLVALNFGEVETLPKLTHSGIADEVGKELMEVVTGYVDKGVITIDEQLEDHIRKVHNLPKKAEGTLLDNQESSDGNNTPSGNFPGNNNPDDDSFDDEVELSDKKKLKTPPKLIEQQSEKITNSIKEVLQFAASKYVNDTLARYKQLPANKKQNATSKVVIAGTSNLKKDLKRVLTETMSLSIDLAKAEIPGGRNIELNDSEKEMLRMSEKFGDISDIKLNDFSKLPNYAQVLIAKQSELISSDSINDLKKRMDFSFSSMETKSSDENVIRQAMEDEAESFIESSQVMIKGVNAASLMVNEGRQAVFFAPEVEDQIHSFTFMNANPKAAICRELAGTTFNTNDAQSLMYHPPLHHNCKSYLRANLKTSKGVDRLEVTSLAPSAEAKKSITL